MTSLIDIFTIEIQTNRGCSKLPHTHMQASLVIVSILHPNSDKHFVITGLFSLCCGLKPLGLQPRGKGKLPAAQIDLRQM